MARTSREISVNPTETILEPIALLGADCPGNAATIKTSAVRIAISIPRNRVVRSGVMIRINTEPSRSPSRIVLMTNAAGRVSLLMTGDEMESSAKTSVSIRIGVRRYLR